MIRLIFTQRQSVEEQLNTVLTASPEHDKPIKFKKADKPSGMQPENGNTLEGKQGKPVEQNAKEQISIPNQKPGTDDRSQANDPAQISGSNKDQGTATEKIQSQGTGNQPVKDKFRASLTADQLSILENQQMSREEKRKALLQSLSAEQKQLLKEQTEEKARQAEINKGAIEAENIKDQQKMRQEQLRESTGKEMKGQQKQQNSESKGNPGNGGKNGPNTGNGESATSILNLAIM